MAFETCQLSDMCPFLKQSTCPPLPSRWGLSPLTHFAQFSPISSPPFSASVPCTALELYVASWCSALPTDLCAFTQAAPWGTSGLPLPTPIYLEKAHRMGLRCVSPRSPHWMRPPPHPTLCCALSPTKSPHGAWAQLVSDTPAPFLTQDCLQRPGVGAQSVPPKPPSQTAAAPLGEGSIIPMAP